MISARLVVGIYEKRETNEKESNEERLMRTNRNREKGKTNRIEKKSVTFTLFLFHHYCS